MPCSESDDILSVAMQAKRLVRNSILSVETTDTQVDDVEFVDDAAEVEDFVRSHQGGGDASGSGAGQPGDLSPASNNNNNNNDNACQPKLGACGDGLCYSRADMCWYLVTAH